MKKRLSMVAILTATVMLLEACSFNLKEKIASVDQAVQDMLESQDSQKDYLRADDDADYVSYDISEDMIAYYKEVYETGDTGKLSQSELSFYQGLKKALDAAKDCSLDVEKEKAVHDWIVLNCKYDYENYESDSLPDTVYTADGVYRYGLAVCDGYQKAFLLALRILGINCKTVVGTGSYDGKEENHAWNAVELDGQWYQVDVTWDDPVPDQEGFVRYTYFNVTDDIMKRNHEYTFDYSCTARTYSYMEYYVGDQVAHNKEELDKIMGTAFSLGELEINVYILEDKFEELVNGYYDYSRNYQTYGVIASAVCTQYIPGQSLSDGSACNLTPYTITYQTVPIVNSQESFDKVLMKACAKGQAFGQMILSDGCQVEDFWKKKYEDFKILRYVNDGYGIYKVEIEPY